MKTGGVSEWYLGCPEGSGPPFLASTPNTTGPREETACPPGLRRRSQTPSLPFRRTGARTEEEYDTLGKLERMDETASTKRGWFTRANRNFPGSSAERHAQRSDGSAVKRCGSSSPR